MTDKTAQPFSEMPEADVKHKSSRYLRSGLFL